MTNKYDNISDEWAASEGLGYIQNGLQAILRTTTLIENGLLSKILEECHPLFLRGLSSLDDNDFAGKPELEKICRNQEWQLPAEVQTAARTIAEKCQTMLDQLEELQSQKSEEKFENN